MSELLIKALVSTIMPITGIIVIKNMLKYENKLLNIKTIIIVILLSIATFFLYDTKYGALITIMNFSIIAIGYKFVFNISYFESFLLSVFLTIIIMFSEMLLCIVVLPFSKSGLEYFRNSLVFGNVAVSIICITISRISLIINPIRRLLLRFSGYSKLRTIIVSVFWFIIVGGFCYVIFSSSATHVDFWLSICVIISFGIFMINHFKDRGNYISLNERFDELYNYVETMEESIENEQLNIHEYKNQLSVISSITNDKKIISYINSLVKNNVYESSINSKLINLPKGGLKGLIYYKLAQAKSKEIDALVDISKNCSSFIKKLSIDDMKELSRIVGIYLDNAIEESCNTKGKRISFEMYLLKKDLIIVVSNSISKEINLQDINKKGVTTKGKGRGRGLYLVSKIIKRNPRYSVETRIINDYFVQKLTIKNTSKK